MAFKKGNKINIGREPWNKGIKTGALSKEHRKKISLALKGRKNPNMARVGKKNGMYGTKGWYAWRDISGFKSRKKGEFKHSEETKKKISKAKKGKPIKSRGVPRPQIQGKKSPNWRGGITKSEKLQRGIFRRYIQKEVLERDNYTCQICGKRGGSLQVDHIQPWKDYVNLRFDINNCRTVCDKCHYKITFGEPMPKNVKSWGHNFKYLERGVD